MEFIQNNYFLVGFISIFLSFLWFIKCFAKLWPNRENDKTVKTFLLLKSCVVMMIVSLNLLFAHGLT
jgi:hypothetical protein